MKAGDEGIRAVRDVRKKISAEFDNDPQRLVEHYLAEQKKHRSRLLRSGVVQPGRAPTSRTKR